MDTASRRVLRSQTSAIQMQPTENTRQCQHTLARHLAVDCDNVSVGTVQSRALTFVSRRVRAGYVGFNTLLCGQVTAMALISAGRDLPQTTLLVLVVNCCGHSRFVSRRISVSDVAFGHRLDVAVTSHLALRVVNVSLRRSLRQFAPSAANAASVGGFEYRVERGCPRRKKVWRPGCQPPPIARVGLSGLVH